MPTTQQDVRQHESRDTITQLSSSSPTNMDVVVRSIDSEVTPPFRMRQNTGSDRVLNIDPNLVTNPTTSRNRITPPVNNLLPLISTTQSITFPAAPGGTVTATLTISAGATTPTWTSTHFLKVGIALDSSGQLILTYGAAAASINAATVPPTTPNTYSLGYVVLINNAGTISNILDGRIYQYEGGMGGGSSAATTEYFKNYLADYFTAELIPGVSYSTFNNGGAPERNVSSFNNFSTSAASSAISITRSAVTPLRETYSYLTEFLNTATTYYFATPAFDLDLTDRVATAPIVLGTRCLYINFEYQAQFAGTGLVGITLRGHDTTTGNVVFTDLGLTSSNSAFGSTGLIINTGTTTTAKFKASVDLGTTTLPATAKYSLVFQWSTGAATTDFIKIDRVYVGPNADVAGNGDAFFVGRKAFSHTTSHKLGVFFPTDHNLTSATFPATEISTSSTVLGAKIIGFLDVPTGQTVNIVSNSALVVVGALTGAGTVSGPGTLISI